MTWTAKALCERMRPPMTQETFDAPGIGGPVTRTRCLPTTRAGIPLVLVLLVALAAGACATRGSVSASNEIATARYAIRDAESQGGDIYAPKEIESARTKLAEAQRATPDVAVRKAEQALVDAQLATAIATRDSARAQLVEAQRVQREAETLRSETTEAVESRRQ